MQGTWGDTAGLIECLLPAIRAKAIGDVIRFMPDSRQLTLTAKKISLSFRLVDVAQARLPPVGMSTETAAQPTWRSSP